MSPILRFLFGLDEGEAPAGENFRWELSGLPHGGWLFFAALVVVAAIVLIVFLYRREKELGSLQRLSLTFLRLAALVLVVLILLNPRILTEKRLTHPGRTLLVFDVSASMSRQDEFEDAESAERVRLERASGLSLDGRPTRAQLAVGALRRQKTVERLEKKNRVALFSCATRLNPLAKLETERDVAPVAKESRLGDSLSEVTRHVGREPMAAVVLISDGRSTAGKPPVEAARRLAGERRVPIYTVGVGKEDFVTNFAVRELAAPDVVEVDFPVQIEAKILLSGIRETVRVALYRHAEDGGGSVRLEEREIEPKKRVLETRLKFIDKLPRNGSFRYTLELPKHPEEIEFRDNKRDVYVSAVEERRRLLLVAGNPTTEYRFLRNFVLRDDGIQTSCWLSSADRGYPQDGDVVIDQLPQTSEELWGYDVVVLLDPEPETLSPIFQEALVDFVAEQGGGLAYVCGESNTPLIAGDGGFRRLQALLPVDIASGGVPPLSAVYQRKWRPRLTAAGDAHPLCQLVDDSLENRERWSRLPAFYYAYPARKLRPGAVGLLATPDDGPLVGLHRVGLGEVVYLGTDELWQWRAASVGMYERFWAGVVRYLALSKRQAGTRQVTVETDRDRYREGDSVRITVQMIDADRRPIEVPRLDAEIEQTAAAKGGGSEAFTSSLLRGASQPLRSTVSLLPVPGKPGRYAGLFRPRFEGLFKVQIEPDGETVFEVEPLSAELEDTSPDFATLEEVARVSGGRFLSLAELSFLEDEIPETSVTEVLGRSPATTWDSTAMIILFCGLLIVEWVLRKLWRLN